ncbi:hypothetical protein AgCh_003824 [Apium graveolens]
MASSHQNLEEMYARLALEEENEEEVLIGENEVVANKQTFVLVYDLPSGMLTEKILKCIGNHVGKFIKMDPENLNGGWKPYVRVRVGLNIEKPLKRRMKLKTEDVSVNLINFKYERLGTFCFVCGKLGHSDRDCAVVYANPTKVIERAYGTWLRAPNKNARNQYRENKWLRNGGVVGRTGGRTRMEKREASLRAEKQLQRGSWRQMEWDGYDQNKSLTAVGSGLEGVMGGKKGEELILVDSKQKRFELEGNMENNMDNDLDGENILVDGSKNGLKNKSGCKIVKAESNFIDFEVENEQVGMWRYTGFYGYPERKRRRESWDMLKVLARNSELPWCVIGDFNDMYEDDKWGGRKHPYNLLLGFRETMMDCELQDLGFVGEKYTWEKSRGQSNWIQERLDRGLANKA